jgi:hypothetical protein
MWRTVGDGKTHDPANGNYCNGGEYLTSLDFDSGGVTGMHVGRAYCCKL